MTDLMTQLRDYGRQIKTDPILSAEAPVVDVAPRPGQTRWGRGLAWAAVAFAVVLTLGGLYLAFSGSDGQVVDQTTVPTPTTPQTEAEVAQLLNSFIEARVAGDGAQEYLNDPEEELPLLYATTSGARYERGEFEPVPGIGWEWPYELAAFKIRMYAGDTVVEQLIFLRAVGRRGLGYEPDGFGTHIPPTTEDGQPVAESLSFFDGEVTMLAAHPWTRQGDSPGIRLVPELPNVAPTTDGGERNGWDSLFVQADPESWEAGCQTGSGPNGATFCVLGERKARWMLEAPEGSSMQVLGIELNASVASMNRALEAATPILESVEFHGP